MLVVQAEPWEGVVPAGRIRDLQKRGTSTFEDALNGLQAAAQQAISNVLKIANPPREVSVQFGVQLATEAGVVVARATASANMIVTFNWTLGDDRHE